MVAALRSTLLAGSLCIIAVVYASRRRHLRAHASSDAAIPPEQLIAAKLVGVHILLPHLLGDVNGTR